MKFKSALVTSTTLLGLVALVTVGVFYATRRGTGPSAGPSSTTALTTAANPHSDQQAAPIPVPIIAGPTNTLIVTVLWDDSQQPVPGTTVTLTCLPARPTDRPAFAVTDAQGKARIKFPQAWTDARLAARHPDAVPEQLDTPLPAQQDLVLRLKQAGRLFGTVRMADGNLPVAGAEVQITHASNPWGNITLRVKDDGAYEAVSLPPGAVTVAAFREDYCSTMNQPEGAPATILAGQRTGPVDLVLAPGAVVIGWVASKATSRPIPGVIIRADKAPNLLKTPPATTDNRGAYRLRYLPEQSVRLTALAEGYVSQGRLVEARVASQSRCDFNLEPGGEVEIRVADEAHKPIPSVQIHIWDWAGQYPNQSAQTNEEGIAHLRNISILGPPDIFPTREGYEQPPSIRPIFAGKAKAQLDFVLKPIKKGNGAFAGKVSDEKGKPLPGITVVWGQPESRDDESTTTANDGAYHLVVNLERPARRLTAFGKGWATQGKDGLAPGKLEAPLTADFTMKPGHWLAGLVVDQQDKPLSDMNVTLISLAPDAGNMTPGQGNLKTGPDGRFRGEDLPAGQVRVTAVDATGKLSATTDTLVDREVRLVVKSPGVIVGQVVDKNTRKPVRDFNIKVSGGGMWFGDRVMNGQIFSSADGRFKLADLRQGERYEMTLEAGGYATKIVKDVLAEATEVAKENVIEISGGTRLQGILLEKGTGTPRGRCAGHLWFLAAGRGSHLG